MFGLIRTHEIHPFQHFFTSFLNFSLVHFIRFNNPIPMTFDSPALFFLRPSFVFFVFFLLQSTDDFKGSSQFHSVFRTTSKVCLNFTQCSDDFEGLFQFYSRF